MRGIGLSISRLSATRAVLAGAAILAGSALRPAHGESSGPASRPDETAMAVPRLTPPAGANGVGLPQPLAPSEAAKIRHIFALQRKGQIPDAIAETARLNDDTLMGHILAARLLNTPTRASAPALTAWLGRYADLPDACAIYALLLRRLPAGAKAPPAPAGALLGSASTALAGNLRSWSGPARDALTRGHDAIAQRLGREAFDKSHGRDGQSAYVAGLAAWRRGNFATSAALFDAASVSEGAGAGLRAAGAYWAARAHLWNNDDKAWRPWMLRAASEPHTLHGMLARRALGMDIPAAPASPILAEADVEAVAATPQGHRAFALLQVGESARAEAELRLLWPVAQARPPLSRALFLVAGAAGLTDLVSDLSGVVNATDADFPVPVLRPRGGFRLDPALVYAVAHVESNFDSQAVSGAGAHGLMQLMPIAAGAVGGGAKLLHDPGQNLKMGQDYLAYLSRADMAGDDLIRVLASYNSGPFAVRAWAASAENDPLLFLEMIPREETRHFVARTLTNLWGYAARFKLPAPSLDELSSGAWPHFAPELTGQGNTGRPAAIVSLH